MDIQQIVLTTQSQCELKNLNVNVFIIVSLFLLFFSITGNADGIDNCTAAPSSSFVVNVKSKGAKGDGITNDTEAIQAAVNQVAGTDGTVLIPDGIYLIDAITSIQIRSNMTLQMSKNTLLKALPNGKDGYNIIKIFDASNINVIDGTLIGERYEHSGVSGQWGMGINLHNANNITIKGVTVRNCWGDGFYIAGASKNVRFCSVVADNNRRQGMSIISVDGMTVKNSIFQNTSGTAPQAGIDLEPNKNDTIANVQIANSQFINNKGYGIQLSQGAGSTNNVTIDGNTISSNAGGILTYNTTGHRIINNEVKNNENYGIRLNRSKGNTVTGNKVTGKNGISDEVGGNSISSNILN